MPQEVLPVLHVGRADWPDAVDSAFPACQKEQKGIDFPPQRTLPRLQSQFDVSLSFFCSICFPKMKPSPGKGPETDSNSDKVKVMVVGCGKAPKGRVSFPIPKETRPYWRKVLPGADCFQSPWRIYHLSFCVPCAHFPVTMVFPQPPSLSWPLTSRGLTGVC